MNSNYIELYYFFFVRAACSSEMLGIANWYWISLREEIKQLCIGADSSVAMELRFRGWLLEFREVFFAHTYGEGIMVAD